MLHWNLTQGLCLIPVLYSWLYVLRVTDIATRITTTVKPSSSSSYTSTCLVLIMIMILTAIIAVIVVVL